MFLYLIIALVFAFCFFCITWCIYILTKNPSIVDLAWTLCVGSISALYFILAHASGPIALFVLISMILWAVRLSTLLGYRLLSGRIDKRYEALSKKWEDNLYHNYFFFYMKQAIAAVVLTLPILFLMSASRDFLWLDILAILLVCIGWIGVFFADYQLVHFLGKKENKDKVCDYGLWNYSRHPNYFFEFIFWIGQFLFAISVPYGFLSVVSPLGLLYLLLFVTGIPLAEEQSLLSKKEAYKNYIDRTSSFIPLPKKKK